MSLRPPATAGARHCSRFISFQPVLACVGIALLSQWGLWTSIAFTVALISGAGVLASWAWIQPKATQTRVRSGSH